MSQIHNRIVTTFSASAGNALAVMGEVASGMYGVGRQSAGAGQQIGYTERQLRAFGTTFRYALAGTAVFALPTLVRNFTELQNRLGDITSIATTTGGLPIVGAQLSSLRDQLLAVSVDTAQPMDNLLEGVTRLYSTLQDVPPNRAAEMMRTISEVANTSQADVTDTTDAILGMLNAYGQGPEKIRAFGNAFRVVIAESAGMTGQMFSMGAGRLFQTGRLGNFSPATIFGAAIAATRFGGSQTSNMNNLSQALLYLMQPPQKNAENALASIGLPQNVRLRLGGDEVLRRVLAEVNRRGFQADPRFLRLSDEALADIPDTSRTGTSGRGAALLQQIFPRIQGRRIAAILATLSGPSPGQGNKSLQQYVADIQNAIDHTNTLDEANKRAMNPRRYQQAAEAMRAFGIQVATALDPILSLGTKGLTGFERLTARHPDATRYGVYAGIGGLLAAYLGRGAIFPALRTLTSRGAYAIPGVAVGQSLMGRAPTGSVDNPFFVIVLTQLGGKGPGGVLQYKKPIGPGTEPGGRGIPGAFTIPGIGLAGGAAAAASIAAIMATPGDSGARGARNQNWLQTHYPSLYAMGVDHLNQYGAFVFRQGVTPANQKALSELHRRHSTGEVNRILRDRLTRVYTNRYGSAGGMNATEIAVALAGTVTLDIDYNQPDGTRGKKRVHVRVDNWGNGTAPQHRGRNKAQRR